MISDEVIMHRQYERSNSKGMRYNCVAEEMRALTFVSMFVSEK